jgi:hypothetical protein
MRDDVSNVITLRGPYPEHGPRSMAELVKRAAGPGTHVWGDETVDSEMIVARLR